MRFEYETNFTVFKLALRTYTRSNPARRFWFHFQMWGSLVLGLVVLIASSIFNELHMYRGLLAPLVGGLVGGGVVGPLLRPWNMRRCYSAWTKGPQGKPFYIEVVGAELHSGIEGQSDTRYHRSAICATAQDEAMLLLFLNKKKFIYLPKSALPPQAIREVQSWLELPGAPPAC